MITFKSYYEGAIIRDLKKDWKPLTTFECFIWKSINMLRMQDHTVIIMTMTNYLLLSC